MKRHSRDLRHSSKLRIYIGNIRVREDEEDDGVKVIAKVFLRKLARI